MNIKSVFGVDKPILGMLHLKGDDKEDILSRLLSETDIYTQNGVTAVIVEDYFGKVDDVEAGLALLQKERPHVIRGVNVLDDFATSYKFAQMYGARFMQVDSAAGHLIPEDDVKYGETISSWRAKGDIFVLGGVRFKYQKYLSGRTLEKDLEIAQERCDAIVVTGDGTGMPTALDKIREFREILGDFPLIVGAGMTPDSCAEQLALSDGAIIGSYFKKDGKAANEVDPERVRQMMDSVRKARE